MAEYIKLISVLVKLTSNIPKISNNISDLDRVGNKFQIEDNKTIQSSTYTFLVNFQGKQYDFNNLCEEGNILNFPQELMTQKVLEIRRYCSSKTGYFPSGLITVFSQTLFGFAYRHEYVIIRTTHYLIKISVPNEDIKDQQNNKYNSPKLIIHIENLFNNEGQPVNEELIYKKFNKDEIYNRVMGKLKDDEILKDLYLDRVVTLIRLWRNLHIEQTCQDSTSDAKSLARSLFYFCHNQTQTDVILCSLIGLYSDKPFYIGLIVNLDGILIEKGVLAAYKEIKKENWENSLKIVQDIIDFNISASVQGFLELQM